MKYILAKKKKKNDWFVRYLNDRCISTCVDGAHSKAQPISSGVPQGSVLGPLLFVLFLSDLPSVVRGSSALFAYDMLAYDRCTGTISSANPDFSSSSSCCRLQSDFQNVNHWFNQTATTLLYAQFWSTLARSGMPAVVRIPCDSSALNCRLRMRACNSSSKSAVAFKQICADVNRLADASWPGGVVGTSFSCSGN